MRKLLYILSFCFLLTSCNDGDIITVDIDFDDTFEYCENDDLVVFYKTKDDPSESLSLKLNTTIEDLIELDDDYLLVNSIETFDLSNSANSFHYRSYNSTLPTSYFCEAVTPDITITSNSESTTGTVTVTTVLSEDDADGIPAEIEDANLDEDDDPATDPTDTDSDGIPDYLDDDDDGDNVPTATENPNYSTETGLEDAQDTDEDGIPDYLDTDDDDDGVLTRDEENETTNEDPTDDITDNTIGADYLNDQVSTVVEASAFRDHTIEQTFTITAEIEDFELTKISLDEYDFGTLSPSLTYDRTVEVDFN